jgi:ABC-type dipeptide/oligopeptide/nickel transport system ATPase component
MLKIADQSLRDPWEHGNGEQASAAIQQFSNKHSESLRQQSPAARGDERAYRQWERGIARWLYSVDHIGVTYTLEYDGLNVEQLSPGSRGIVLLLLYLAVDQAETDPLIIDQPEENLDPESVFSELVTLLQMASQRRQIIMITHNANLVVNTDVDQVIVAHCGTLEEGKLPSLSYIAGGLEDPVIRGAVCDVLEGGAEAFRQRARRLRIDAPATLSVED